MTKEDNLSRAVAQIGASTAAAMAILISSDSQSAETPVSNIGYFIQGSEISLNLHKVLLDMQEGAEVLNEILDEVLLAAMNDPRKAARFDVSRMALLVDMLRSLEHHVRNATNIELSSSERKAFARCLASIRSRAVDILDFKKQLQAPAESYRSDINLGGLAALAALGTENLKKIAG
nr:hypothetical protein [Pseudomonas luteola]